jgi:CHAD domain-containing protein
MLMRPKDPALEAMREAVERRRTAAYEDVRHALDSPRAAALAFDVAAASAEIESSGESDRPIVTLARRALDERFAKVRRRGRRLRKLDVEQRHQLRIQLKKLRYGIDFFSGLFAGKKRKKFTAELAELQDLFGALNDAATAERLAADLYGPPGQATAEQTLACGLVIGWHLSESRLQYQRLVTLWGRWADDKPFWR